MKTSEDVRDVVRPSRVTEAIVVAVSAAAVVVAYRVVRFDRRWAVANSPFAGPRARAATFKTSYQKKRSGLDKAAEVIGELLGALEAARPHA